MNEKKVVKNFNDIGIGSRVLIRASRREFPGTIVRSSHDGYHDKWIFKSDVRDIIFHTCDGAVPNGMGFYLFDYYFSTPNDYQTWIFHLGPKVRKKTGFGLFLEKHGL